MKKSISILAMLAMIITFATESAFAAAAVVYTNNFENPWHSLSRNDFEGISCDTDGDCYEDEYSIGILGQYTLPNGKVVKPVNGANFLGIENWYGRSSASTSFNLNKGDKVSVYGTTQMLGGGFPSLGVVSIYMTTWSFNEEDYFFYDPITTALATVVNKDTPWTSYGAVAPKSGYTDFFFDVTVVGNVELFAGIDSLKITSTVPDGKSFAKLSTAPVPVPAAVWLLGSAFGGVAAIRRRKTA